MRKFHALNFSSKSNCKCLSHGLSFVSELRFIALNELFMKCWVKGDRWSSSEFICPSPFLLFEFPCDAPFIILYSYHQSQRQSLLVSIIQIIVRFILFQYGTFLKPKVFAACHAELREAPDYRTEKMIVFNDDTATMHNRITRRKSEWHNKRW